MRKPQIGIPLTLDHRERWRKGRAYHYIDRAYADAIDQAGGHVVHLPIQSDPISIVDSLDGLLIPGGDDFPDDQPLPPEVTLDLVSTEQLAFDEAIFEAASRRRIPVLGICYGMQLMARLRNGVLDVHLPTQRPKAQSHKLSEARRHAISIESNSRLASIFGTSNASVNSLHHQAIREVGSAHRVVASSSDGVIEAIEANNVPGAASPWELGVQWHPEKLRDSGSDRLFLAFIDACRESSNAI